MDKQTMQENLSDALSILQEANYEANEENTNNNAEKLQEIVWKLALFCHFPIFSTRKNKYFIFQSYTQQGISRVKFHTGNNFVD
jgi:predicted double-glycine peptidase